MSDINVDADLLVAAGAVTRQLSVDDFKAAATGAASQTTLAAILTAITDADEATSLAALNAIRTAVEDLAADDEGIAREATLASLNAKDFATQAKLEAVRALLAGTLAVSAVSLPLPTGAATQTTLAAQKANLDLRYAGGKTSVVGTATTAGDTTIHTPASGKAIRLYWVSAINDPDSAATPLIKVRLGSAEKYRAYALAHWEVFTGAVNDPLVVNLDEVGSVAVTAHLEEI